MHNSTQRLPSHVVSGFRLAERRRGLRPFCGEPPVVRQNLVNGPLDALKVVPRMGMIPRSVDAASTDDMRSHRRSVETGKEANDLVGTKRPTATSAAQTQRGPKNFEMDGSGAHAFK